MSWLTEGIQQLGRNFSNGGTQASQGGSNVDAFGRYAADNPGMFSPNGGVKPTPAEYTPPSFNDAYGNPANMSMLQSPGITSAIKNNLQNVGQSSNVNTQKQSTNPATSPWSGN